MKTTLLNTKIHYLGNLYTNFRRAEIAYDNYLKDDKIFLHARILKECNFITRKLLLQHSYLLGQGLHNDAVDLVCHYDIWFEKWNDLEEKQKPQLQDVFVFENKHRFPKEAEQRLKEEFIKLINI